MRYGLLGKGLMHSFSPEIHSKFADYTYELFDIENEDGLKDFFDHTELAAINITMPYKKAVMQYCDEITDEALKIGAVNTIVWRGGKSKGYNTDFFGFIHIIKKRGIEIAGKDIVILGTGATSKTAHVALEHLGAKSIQHVSREGKLNYSNVYEQEPQVLINTTPVGMYPKNGVTSVDLDKFNGLEAVVDVIYNPLKTQLILDAERLGIKAIGGLGMVVEQARVASELFTDSEISEEKGEKVFQSVLRKNRNITIIGMPGSGKSTIGRVVANNMQREFYDLDRIIVERHGSIEDLINLHGEDRFREIETDVLKEISSKTGVVISTGGGIVKLERNYNPIRQNSRVYLLDRPIEKLATDGRPLSQGGIERLHTLYSERKDKYEKFTDVRLENHDRIDKTADELVRDFYEN